MACRFVAFTVTNNPDHPGAERLARSAKYWGWDLKWIQQDIDRVTFGGQQLGQLEALRKFEPEYFLYLDAWDTIFTGPPQELQFIPGVLTFGGDTVLTEGWAELGQCAKISSDDFPPVPVGGFRYVNDGTLWGDSLILQELAGDYLQNYSQCINQDYFNKRLAFEHGLFRKRLQVDYKAQVSLNIMGTYRREVDCLPNHRLLYLPFKTTPLVLHSPGTAGKEPVAPIPKWMVDEYCAE